MCELKVFQLNCFPTSLIDRIMSHVTELKKFVVFKKIRKSLARHKLQVIDGIYI